MSELSPPTRHFYFAENPTFLNWFDTPWESLPSNGGPSAYAP